MPVPREQFELNEVLKPWPSVTDVKEWIDTSGGHGQGISDADAAPLQWVLDAAITRISRLTRCDVYKRQAEAVVDPVTGVKTYPTIEPLELNEVNSDVWLATVMLTARLMARKGTASGLAGSAEFSSLVRTSATDPDIMALLGDSIVYGLA